MNDRLFDTMDRIARSAEKLGYYVMKREDGMGIYYGYDQIAAFDTFSAVIKKDDGSMACKVSLKNENELITLYTRIDDFLLRKFRKINCKYTCALNIFNEYDKIVAILQEYTQSVKQAEKKIRIMEIEDE